jgi:hypothetical protein
MKTDRMAIVGLIIGIIVGVLCTLLTQKLLKSYNSTTGTSIIGSWQMPSDLALIEPLKPDHVEITNNNDGYVIIQGPQRTKLVQDGNYFIPTGSGEEIVGIRFEYNATDDTMIQGINEKPFVYTRRATS